MFKRPQIEVSANSPLHSIYPRWPCIPSCARPSQLTGPKHHLVVLPLGWSTWTKSLLRALCTLWDCALLGLVYSTWEGGYIQALVTIKRVQLSWFYSKSKTLLSRPGNLCSIWVTHKIFLAILLFLDDQARSNPQRLTSHPKNVGKKIHKNVKVLSLSLSLSPTYSPCFLATARWKTSSATCPCYDVLCYDRPKAIGPSDNGLKFLTLWPKIMLSSLKVYSLRYFASVRTLTHMESLVTITKDHERSNPYSMMSTLQRANWNEVPIHPLIVSLFLGI